MGYSIQDIDTRLSVVEDKLDFIMSAGRVTKRERSFLDPRGYVETNMSMLDLYRELKTQGLEIVEAEPVNENV